MRQVSCKRQNFTSEPVNFTGGNSVLLESPANESLHETFMNLRTINQVIIMGGSGPSLQAPACSLQACSSGTGQMAASLAVLC